MEKEGQYCDPVTGEYTAADLRNGSMDEPILSDLEIIYVGDPMCSWCWGISNHLKELKNHFSDYKFSIVLGGLRPGGGEAWDDQLKAFLRHHWEEVNERSGQPFGYALFDREEFNYDTEPACRAVVTARKWMGNRELEFYEAVSRKFYVENQDPSLPEFYQSICGQFDINFNEFITDFESDQLKYQTNQDFQLNRQWGVRGYPTVLFKTGDQLYQVNNGYMEFDQMKSVIEKINLEVAVS